MQPFAERRVLAMRVAGEQTQRRSLVGAVEDVEHALLGRDHRRQLREHHSSDRQQIALALKHARELGEVRLQPVLLGVLERRVLQVADHLVDVVFECRHLRLRLHLDRPREIALRHRRRHLGDRAHLRGEVCRQPVDVVGEVLPGAGGAGHAGLAAKLAFDADFARHGRHLIGEGRQRVDHAVDRVGERRDLAFSFDSQLPCQVAVGDGRDDSRDAAHLAGQVAGHEVDVVGEVLPRARHAGHRRLAPQLAFGADLARDACDLGRERAELIDHRVDDVLDLQDLAANIDA